ncbi:MAG: type I-U CRISPR-associated protein Cas5/Cas6 [Rhodospirillales bacterium]|nr:type I-U CRISPR-associated protein Cas5/Cas6 [Rhodospirillales bacterium]
MSLVLEIEFLSGVSFAAIGPESDAPDWPPQPDRIFSALVAAWAARGKEQAEAEALEWLEVLPPPKLCASAATPRTAPSVFVPPNDPRSDKGKHAKGVLPALRSRQPRRFPAARPDDPVVRLRWEVEPPEAVFSALQRLAGDTAYVGHSASLTRCWFWRGDEPAAGASADPAQPRRRVYGGRLAELRRAFAAGRRPSFGPPVTQERPEQALSRTVFAERWMILEHLDGEMPDLRASALVAKAIRDALLSGYRQIGLEDAIPEAISGHAADGAPALAPHLAVVPLPFVGFPYADGHVMGFALVPPQDGAILDDQAFRRAMRAIAPIENRHQRRVMTIKPREGAPYGHGFEVLLSPTIEPPAGKRSLDPLLYTRPARIFATVTPIALDRHLKESGVAREAEIQAQIAAACRNIGLPEPDEIVADKHSAFEGAPSAYPSGFSPAWMRWRLPPVLASRQLTHAIVRFSEPVRGSVILGAGRFVGLGLCRPLDTEGR